MKWILFLIPVFLIFSCSQSTSPDNKSASAQTETEKQQAGLARTLTTESNCHSMWLIHRSPLRSWYHLSIYNQSPSTGSIENPNTNPQSQDKSPNNHQTNNTADKRLDNIANKNNKTPQPIQQTSSPSLTVFSFEW